MRFPRLGQTPLRAQRLAASEVWTQIALEYDILTPAGAQRLAASEVWTLP